MIVTTERARMAVSQLSLSLSDSGGSIRGPSEPRFFLGICWLIYAAYVLAITWSLTMAVVLDAGEILSPDQCPGLAPG